MVYNFVRLYPISSCMMFFRMSQTDENGTQHRKHIGLDESHQQFQTVHENHEQETHNGQGSTNHGTNWHVMNITQVRERIMACPPIMLAKRRTIRAKGLVKMPNNSITGIIGTGTLSQVGTGGQSISFQYSLFPKRLTSNMVHTARKKVMLMLPVIFAPPGKTGMSPKRLVMKMKKKAVRRKGA